MHEIEARTPVSASSESPREDCNSKMRANPAQTLNLARQHSQAGNLLEAERLCLQIIHDDPSHVDAHFLLATIENRVGRHDLAIQRFRSVLQANPSHFEAYTTLGIALHGIGNPEEGLACFREAVHLKPNSPEALNNLGNALQLQGKASEALPHLQKAVLFKPGYVGALVNLGVALQKLGRLDEAAVYYQQVLRLMPNHAEAHNNLGAVLHEQGKLAESAASIRQALFYKPDHADAHYNLGCVLLKQEMLTEAVASFENALRVRPNYVEAHTNLGKALHGLGKFHEAKDILEQALRLQPDLAIARCNLGNVLQHLGDFKGAEREYRTVLRHHPRHADALWQIASILRGDLPEVDRTSLEEGLSQPDLSDADRSRLLFGLAEVCDAKEEFAQAAAHLQEANALSLKLCRKQGKAYDLGENARFVDNVIAAFTPAYFERVRGFGLETEMPVFIVGLPRSGTTLIEQILAAHSQVFGAGELQLANEDCQALKAPSTQHGFFATPSGPQRDHVRFLAQRHLDQLRSLNSTATRVVDKMPDNYLLLGLLATLFPRAKFIHCRRDLRDVAVSCWMTHFVNLRWTNHPEHIVVRFREYRRVMEYWRSVLPVPLLEVNYEDTVADLPGVARRLVEWCGLEWEPECLQFHESNRPICTASVVQARQPVYTRSVGRWRNYEREMSELFTALEPLQDRES
jgi:tetratricopeptide (TPR) repeat protein